MDIKTSLQIADKIGNSLERPKGVPLENVLWSVRVLAGAYRRSRTVRVDLRDKIEFLKDQVHDLSN